MKEIYTVQFNAWRKQKGKLKFVQKPLFETDNYKKALDRYYEEVNKWRSKAVRCGDEIVLYEFQLDENNYASSCKITHRCETKCEVEINLGGFGNE